MKYFDLLNQAGEHRDRYKIFVVGPGEKEEVETVMEFDALRTSGNTEVKAVVINGGELNLKGILRIKKSGEMAEAFLKQNVLLVGEGSRAVAVPELEIETNEVKASHAAAVGRLDEEQLFYLQSRGLSKQEASKLIIEAFVDDILTKMDKDEGLAVKEKINKLIMQDQ